MNPLKKLHDEQMEEFDDNFVVMNTRGRGRTFQLPGAKKRPSLNTYNPTEIKSFITSHNLKQIDEQVEWLNKFLIEYDLQPDFVKKQIIKDRLSFLEEYKSQIKS